MCCNSPPAEASSAYQHCFTSRLSLFTSGRVARENIAMAGGSPCVVPSWEGMISPPMYKLDSCLYVFIRAGTMLGQPWRMLISAVFRLRLLNVLIASTWRMAWHDGNSNTLLIAWIAASHTDCWPTHVQMHHERRSTFVSSQRHPILKGLLLLLYILQWCERAGQ